MIRCVVGIMALGMSLFALDASAISRGTDRARGQAVWDAAVNGKTTTVGGGNGSMTVIGPYKPSTVDANGNVALKTGGNAPVNGQSVPVEVTGTISKGDIASAALSALACAKGGVAGAVICGGAVIATPIALQWLSNAGVRVNPTTKELEKTDPTVCRVAPCTDYQFSAGGFTTAWVSSGLLACTAWGSLRSDTPYQWRNPRWSSVNPNTCTFDLYNADGSVFFLNNSVNGLMDTHAVPPSSGDWSSAGIDEATGLMNNSRIPSGDIVKELDMAGQSDKMPASDIKVTGPASVKGPTVTNVTNNSSTSTTTNTTTTTNNYIYNNNTVTNTNSSSVTTTTTTTKNPDGTTTTTTGPTTTTTTTPGDSSPPEEAAPSDTALPPVPSLYARKYPNGMEGIWSDYKDQLKGTSLVSLVGKLMPNVGDGGSCPTWPINLELAQWASYGTHDVAPPCWIWDVAKAILVLSALLLARALVFGG